MTKILVLTFTLFVAELTVAAESITLHTGEWAPLTSQELKHGGLGPRIIKEAFLQQGIKVNYQWTQWKRGYEMAKSKSSSTIGSILYVKNAEREEDFYFSEPIIESQSVFFHLKSKPLLWQSFADLRGKNILVTRGYSYAELDPFLKKKDHFALIHETDTDMQGLTMLLHRSQAYDLLPINKLVGLTTIRNNFSPEDAAKFTFHPKKFGVVPLHLIIRKDKKLKKYVEAFNAGLKKLKSSGSFEKYMDESYKKEK